MRVWGELKRDYVEVIKDLGNERMKGEEDRRLQNYLAKGHVTATRKLWFLIPKGPSGNALAYIHERRIPISWWKAQIPSPHRRIGSWSPQTELRWLKA